MSWRYNENIIFKTTWNEVWFMHACRLFDCSRFTHAAQYVCYCVFAFEYVPELMTCPLVANDLSTGHSNSIFVFLLWSLVWKTTTAIEIPKRVLCHGFSCSLANLRRLSPSPTAVRIRNTSSISPFVGQNMLCCALTMSPLENLQNKH